MYIAKVGGGLIWPALRSSSGSRDQQLAIQLFLLTLATLIKIALESIAHKAKAFLDSGVEITIYLSAEGV
jgi:hypothetical protein